MKLINNSGKSENQQRVQILTINNLKSSIKSCTALYKSKVVYKGTSLDDFMNVKSKLKAHNIKYRESVKGGDPWYYFFLLNLMGIRGYPMRGKKINEYCIYVNKSDFLFSKHLIIGLVAK